jgi:hypothetical protein
MAHVLTPLAHPPSIEATHADRMSIWNSENTIPDQGRGDSRRADEVEPASLQLLAWRNSVIFRCSSPVRFARRRMWWTMTSHCASLYRSGGGALWQRLQLSAHNWAPARTGGAGKMPRTFGAVADAGASAWTAGVNSPTSGTQ